MCFMCVCMYVGTYVCMYVFTRMYVYVCIHIHTCIYIHMCIYTHTSLYLALKSQRFCFHSAVLLSMTHTANSDCLLSYFAANTRRLDYIDQSGNSVCLEDYMRQGN